MPHFLSALVMGLAATLLAAAAQAEPTIYSGGPIITMEGDEAETVEAVAVADGIILATGTVEDVRTVAGEAAVDHDLGGRTMLPGFIDAHGHVAAFGRLAFLPNLSPPPVGGVDSIASLQTSLRDHARSANAPLVIGWGYDDSLMVERRHPTRHELDAVFSDKPILAVHASGHLAVANSAMLRFFGIDSNTPNPVGGIIRREEDGVTPNGVLEETALFESAAKLPSPSLDIGVQTLVAGAQLFAGYGITTAQDGRTMPDEWQAMAEASKRGVLPIDIAVLLAGERDWPDDVLASIDQPSNGRVRIAGIKLALDGSPQGRTAWLRDPVPVPPDGAEPGYRGYPLMSDEQLDALLGRIGDNGWQLFAHVNGDAAAQALIDGVRRHGLEGRRTVAIHNQVVRPEQLTEMAELDIQPSFFANHTFFWGDWHRDVALGAKRADFISPQRSAWGAGLRPTAHNDSPVVPPDMMRLIWSSVNRRTRSGDILGPLERISPYRALQQVTINAAWQIREEGTKGSITPGKRADLVILDRNPLTVEPMEIKDIQVVATIKDGELVHDTRDQAD